MHNYYTPDSYEFDCDPITPADYGWVHENDIPNLDNVKKHLKGIVNSVYFSGDIDELENCLDEVCEEFDLKLPTVDPVICHNIKNFSDNLFDLGIALSSVQASQGRAL